jgi:2-polyprenyl-6-methoxyphenol hydroxylase-like FAD-dependent oxidoreductase
VQLAAIAAGAPQGLREGAVVSMLVVGARGAASVWRFQVRSIQSVSWSQGTSEALWLQREPQHPYDLRVEVWLDPARDFWPLRVRQTQIPGGEATEWQLSEQPRPAPGT